MNHYIERCEECKFSLVNINGEMECRFGSVPGPIVLPIDWCGRWRGIETKTDVPRKAHYAKMMQGYRDAAEVEKAEAAAKKRKAAAKKAESKKQDSQADTPSTDEN